MATEVFRLFGSILLDTSETDKSLAKTEKSGKNLASTLASGAKTVVAAGAAIGAAATAAGTAIYGIAKSAAGTTDEIDKMMNKKSGMLGISGVTSDNQEIERLSKEGNERCRLVEQM